jgi:hypothetical protein
MIEIKKEIKDIKNVLVSLRGKLSIAEMTIINDEINQHYKEWCK